MNPEETKPEIPKKPEAAAAPMAPAPAAPTVKARIAYDDFAKVEMTVGKILAVEPVPKSEKLLKLSVDFAETDASGVRAPRTILSGIAKYFPDAQSLVGRRCMFVTNLEPRPMMGLESNGMILAVSTADGRFSLLEPQGDIPEGTKAR